MRKKKRMGLNIGTSSILLVFVLLCMVTFAALSYVSANADYKLSRSLADRTSAYYDAVNSAEEALALLDEQLAQLAADSAGTSAYMKGSQGFLRIQTRLFRLPAQIPEARIRKARIPAAPSLARSHGRRLLMISRPWKYL